MSLVRAFPAPRRGDPVIVNQAGVLTEGILERANLAGAAIYVPTRDELVVIIGPYTIATPWPEHFTRPDGTRP